jgi:hypothetical protein
MAYGDMNKVAGLKEAGNSDLTVLSCRSTLFNLLEFILAKTMGTELPWRCPACKNCKECRF